MPTPTVRSDKGHYVPYLDAVRSFAVLSVVAVHAGVPGFDAGWLGVDLFFALSGFLITTLLLSEWSRTADISLRKFWARRFLRLMPAYYFYILFVTLALWFWPQSVFTASDGWTPQGFTLALWAYFINFAPSGGLWNGQGATLHLWSLAIEEQYYLFWPISLLLILKYSKHRMLISWGLFAAVLVYFMVFATNADRHSMLYARGFSLFLASAIAVSLQQCQGKSGGVRSLLQPKMNFLLGISVASTLGIVVITQTHIMTEEQIRHYLLPPLVLSYVLSIAALWYVPLGPMCKFLLSRPALLYIGKISYGVYLYHQILRIFVWWVTANTMTTLPRVLAYGVRLTMYVGLTLAISSASYRYLERPFLELKNRFRPGEASQQGPTTLAAAPSAD